MKEIFVSLHLGLVAIFVGADAMAATNTAIVPTPRDEKWIARQPRARASVQ